MVAPFVFWGTAAVTARSLSGFRNKPRVGESWGQKSRIFPLNALAKTFCWLSFPHRLANGESVKSRRTEAAG